MIDKDIQFLLNAERKRQQGELNMIASENYVSPAVMKAMSNVFTNKYSEGYPLARYYQGQENVDKLETLCQYRALKMMGLIKKNTLKVGMKNYTVKMQQLIKDNKRGVNVQPLSGSPANAAVLLSMITPGDTILGMNLSAGGHLSHGHKLNMSGLLYKIVSYGVDEKTYLIDYKDLEKKALESFPAMIIAGFSAYSGTIERKKFDDIAKKVEKKHGARPLLMADIAHIAGLIAGEAIEGPWDYFDIVTTTTHKTLRGPRGALIYYLQTKEDKSRNRIDRGKVINRGVFPGIQGGPHIHTLAAKAVAFNEAMQPAFKRYAKNVIDNAKHLAAELHDRGWEVISGGTENHIILLDVTQAFWGTEKTSLTGSTAAELLESIGIIVNKNMLPFDERSPVDPSGIRIGTAALTTRGMGTKEMTKIATIIELALLAPSDKTMMKKLSVEAAKLAKAFPII